MRPSRLDAPDEQRWQAALEVARSPREAGAWQKALAETLQNALKPDAVAVFLCSFGDMLEGSGAVAPEAARPLGEQLAHEVLPRLLRDGFVAPGSLFEPASKAELPAAVRSVYTERIEPAGFAGLFGSLLYTEDGRVIGWIAVFSRRPAPERFACIGERFLRVCRTCEATMRACVSLASAVGARFPSLTTHTLSPRERAVAALAASGFSDLNIAQRLGIAEGTVGQHLHSIFRKLGVSSRAELGAVLCGEPGDPGQGHAACSPGAARSWSPAS